MKNALFTICILSLFSCKIDFEAESTQNLNELNSFEVILKQFFMLKQITETITMLDDNNTKIVDNLKQIANQLNEKNNGDAFDKFELNRSGKDVVITVHEYVD